MTTATQRRLVAIVGRPNVGKSRIFNRLVGSRRSIVDDTPGVTRDRIFGRVSNPSGDYFLCDTGGFEPHSGDNIKKSLVRQAELAIDEAKLVLFTVDAREGLHPVDAELMRYLRKSGKKVLVLANKCDRNEDEFFSAEFRKLGTSDLIPISAEHGRNFDTLEDAIITALKIDEQSLGSSPENLIKLAIVGRPNVGKSSILNALVGEERSIVDPRPGTTRDYVDVFVNAFHRSFQILDTAGIRRKSRVSDKFETFSIVRSIAQLEECNIAVLVIDASEGATEGDVRVAGYAFEKRIPLLIVVNKWDLVLDKTSKTTDEYKKNVLDSLRYVAYAPVLFVSALENFRVSRILQLASEIYAQSEKRIPTSQVNRTLKDALVKHTPPLTKSRSSRIKFYYASQVSVNPPRFVVFCSHANDIHFSYKRYLENFFREAFGFSQIPLALHFRDRTRRDLTLTDKSGRKAPYLKAGAEAMKRQPMPVAKGSADDDIRSLSDEDFDRISEIELGLDYGEYGDSGSYDNSNLSH